MTMRRNANTNTNDNATLTITPQGNSASLLRGANRGLIARVKTNDPKAQFQLGMIMLCEGRVGFARILLRDAARGGNDRAMKYLSLLHDSKRSVTNWRQLIIDLEAKFIMFGD